MGFSLFTPAQTRAVLLNVFWIGYAIRLAWVWRRFQREQGAVARDLEAKPLGRGETGGATDYRTPRAPALLWRPTRGARWSFVGFHLLPRAWGPLWFVVLVVADDLEYRSRPLVLSVFGAFIVAILVTGHLFKKAREAFSTPSVDLPRWWARAAVGSAIVGVLLSYLSIGAFSTGDLSVIGVPFMGLVATAGVVLGWVAWQTATHVRDLLSAAHKPPKEVSND